jgi:ketosteroid isomerase-like protein
MRKNAFILFFLLLIYGIAGHVYAAGNHQSASKDNLKKGQFAFKADTTLPGEVMDVIKAAVYSLNNFDIEKVANLYTPNASVADDEPPYSWNGPTAGVQWVNAVEQVCKDNKLTKLKGSIETISVYQQNADNIYVVVPVSYNGLLPGSQRFNSKGAFTFVLRLINGKWLIKSQVWMPKRGF